MRNAGLEKHKLESRLQGEISKDPMISIVMGADRLYNMGLVIKDGGRKKVVIEDGYVLKPRKYRNGKERD